MLGVVEDVPVDVGCVHSLLHDSSPRACHCEFEVCSTSALLGYGCTFLPFLLLSLLIVRKKIVDPQLLPVI